MSVRLRPMKSGRGRAGGVTLKVPDVETVACPARTDGPHELTNIGGRVPCVWCGREWAAIDGDIRAALGWSA